MPRAAVTYFLSALSVVLSTAVVVWGAQECADELSVGNVVFFVGAGVAWAGVLACAAMAVEGLRRG